MSSRISSRVVPRAATEKACVWPRVKIAEPCVRGATPTSIQMSPDLVGGAAVGALLVDGDPLPDDVLLERVERQLDGGAALRRRPRGPPRGRRKRLERLLLDPLGRVLALELVHHLGGVVERRRRSGPAPRRRTASSTCGGVTSTFSLPACLAQLALGLAELLDLAVGDVERVEDLGLGDLVGAGLDHEDGLLGAGDDEVERRLEQPLLVGVDDEAALRVLADPHGADGRRERDVGDHQRGAGAVHGEDVVGVLVVDRHRDRDELRLARPALGEERAQRTVDHPRGQGGLLAGAALALEEAAGDLARGVHALLDVHRQREEVDVARVACGGGGEDHRVPCGDDHGAARLLGELAGLE